MSSIRLSGEASCLDALKPQLIAAGFSLSDGAQCFLHVGTARDCPTEGSGLLLADDLGPAELDLLTAGQVDVVRRSTHIEEICARLRRVGEVRTRRAEDFFDNLQDGVVVVDNDGHVLLMNEIGSKVLGPLRADERPLLLDLANPVDRAQRQTLVQAMRAGDRIGLRDVEIRLRNERRIIVSMSAGPLALQPGCSVISFRDVTEARNTERELRKTRDFLHHLVEGSSDAIVASDMRGRLVVFNAAAARLFETPIEEAKHKVNVIALYPRGGAREMMRLLREAPNNHIEAVRTYGITRTGGLVPIEVSASLIKMNGAEVATVGVLRDIRERVRVEGELSRARAKLMDSEKQQAVTALAGATAHELNQPLTVILGYIELLRRKADESQRKPIEAIAAHAERMAEIVRRIAKLTHVEVVPYPGKLQIADLEKPVRPRS